MKYLEYVNQKLKDILAKAPPTVAYGQNINAGSCIGGYTKGIQMPAPSLNINSINAENTLTGVGFGLMHSGVNALFFMKQLDFLLLGIDQIVNTNNIIRTHSPRAAFSIMPIIVDSGYEGPQSSLNTLPDFSSIAQIDSYSLTTRNEIDFVLDHIMLKPGFRIIAFSQRLLKNELLSFPNQKNFSPNGGWFQFDEGKDLTIVCFNLSMPQGFQLTQVLKEKNIQTSLFSVHNVSDKNWSSILKNVQKTKRIVILDDTKSKHSASFEMAYEAARLIPPHNVFHIKRAFSDQWFTPQHDTFEVDIERLNSWYNSTLT